MSCFCLYCTFLSPCIVMSFVFWVLFIVNFHGFVLIWILVHCFFRILFLPFLTSVSQMSFVNCFQGLLSSLLCIKNFLLVFIRVLSCLVLFLVLCLLSPVSLIFCLLYLLYCLLCLLSFICWGVSSVHCLVSVVVFCLLSVVMCALPSVFVKCLISNVLCLFFCHMSFLYCHFSFIFCQLSFLFCHLSSIFCQLSCRVSFAFCPSLHLLSWNLCISIGQDLIASL